MERNGKWCPCSSRAKRAAITGFADHLTMDIFPKEPEDVKVYPNENISALKAWVEKVQLDQQIGEAVLITNRMSKNSVSVRIGGHIITSKPVIRRGCDSISRYT